MSHIQNIQKSTQPGSIIQITGILPTDFLKSERKHMVEILSHQIRVDGFRPGTVPEAMILAQVGEKYVQEKTAEHALEHELQHILIEHKVLPIVPPHISIQLHEDGSAQVTISATVYPTVTMPDYKAIAHDVNKGRTDVEVTDADVLDALTHFRRERLRVESVEEHRNDDGTLRVPETEILKKADETAVENLPPLDDAFVTQIGFDSVAAFEEHVKKELLAGKTEQARSERRAHLLAKLCEKPIADVPEPLIEYELAKMEASLAEYLSQAGRKLDEYYAAIKKTKQDLYAEWKPEATKRAEHQLALIEIAKRENIHEDEKELSLLVEQVLKRNPDAEQRSVHSHYQVVLRNQKVLEWLEQQ